MFAKLIQLLRRLDPIMLAMMVVLLCTGILFIYGSGQQLGGRFAGYWHRQLLFVGAGLVAFAVLAACDYRRLAWLVPLAYAASCALLVLLFFFGKTINGSRSWFVIGPFTLQPAELAKPATILFLAWLATRTAVRLNRWLDIAIFGLAAGLPVFLVSRQPDWGTALVFVPVAVAMAFAGGLPWRHLLAAALLVAILAPLSYHFVLRDYQRSRIDTFFRPAADRTGAGYNANQSLLAVGSGGLFGKGVGRGDQYKLGYLPRNVAPTDFIFSVIGEETGLVGGLILIGALLALIGTCLRSAIATDDPFGALLCVGVATVLFVHTYVNIGMTIGAAPIIGIPLPLVSYGGSFMVGTLLCLGLAHSVYSHRQPASRRPGS